MKMSHLFMSKTGDARRVITFILAITLVFPLFGSVWAESAQFTEKGEAQLRAFPDGYKDHFGVYSIVENDENESVDFHVSKLENDEVVSDENMAETNDENFVDNDPIDDIINVEMSSTSAAPSSLLEPSIEDPDSNIDDSDDFIDTADAIQAILTLGNNEVPVEIAPEAVALLGENAPINVLPFTGGTPPEPFQPAPTVGQISIIKFVAAETNYLGGLALDAAGKVWTWGYDASGMLGTHPNFTESYAGGMIRVPFFVDNDIFITQIVGGYHTSYALAATTSSLYPGRLFAWGNGSQGQMGNNTVTSANHTPTLVSSLPYDEIEIIKVVTSSENASCTYVLARDTRDNRIRIFAFGYADGYRIPDNSGYVRTAQDITHRFDPVITPGEKIVDIELGNQHGIVLDSAGDIYTWGYNNHDQLGLGSSASGYYNYPQKVTFFENIEIVSISANSDTSLAVDIDGNAWQWGRIYGYSSTNLNRTYTAPGGWTYKYASSGSSTDVHTPEIVLFDLDSTDDFAYPYSDAPKAAAAIAGKYVNYIIDVYGRIWFWGYNYAYSFGTDGTLLTTSSSKHTNYVQKATLLKTLGDGDTEYNNDNHTYTKAPVFSGSPVTAAQFSNYSNYGSWWSFDGLHPTIYDKKYMETTDGGNPSNHDRDYPLDKDGNRLVYVMRRDANGTYSANFYIAEDSYTGVWALNRSGSGSGAALPAGITEVTSTPVVKENERGWIGLVVELDDFGSFAYDAMMLKELPYISALSTFQSATLFIDDSGNLYKTSLDGSGSIAWGWDYSDKYYASAQGSLARGMYNLYCYEVMYMRGAPSVAAIEIAFEKPFRKIYLVDESPGVPPVETVKISVTVPAGVNDPQLNLQVNSQLLELRYVFIPYDPTDSNFLLTDFTREEFEAAFEDDRYEVGDLLKDTGVLDGTYSIIDATFEVEIGENGKFWVLGKEQVYNRVQDRKVVYVADNFYTVVDIQHQGVDEEKPHRIAYPLTTDNVVKTSTDPSYPLIYPAAPDNEDYFGIPLDANGNVIPDPHWGYDSVRISRYDASATPPTEPYPDFDKYWEWVTSQDEYEDVILNDASDFFESKNVPKVYVHDFLYKLLEDYEVTGDKIATSDENITVAAPGDTIHYEIIVEHKLPGNGLDALYVDIKDDMSQLWQVSGVQYIEDPRSIPILIIFNEVAYPSNETNRIDIYTVGDLMAGITIESIPFDEFLTIKFDVVVKSDLNVNIVTELLNTIHIGKSLTLDGKIDTGEPHLEGSKTVSDDNLDGKASSGEILTYTITVRNTGKVKATDVLIRDTLSELLKDYDEYIYPPTGNGITIERNGSATSPAEFLTPPSTVQHLIDGFTILEILPADEITITFDVTVITSLDMETVLRLRNTAEVRSASGNLDLYNEIPTGDPDILGIKTVIDENGDGIASPGEKLTYTIYIENIGSASGSPVPIANIFVQDDMDDLLSPSLVEVRKNGTDDEIIVTFSKPVNIYSDRVMIPANQIFPGTVTIDHLINGFYLDQLDPDESITLVFTVWVKDIDVTQVKSLSNMSTHGSNTIQTGIPVLTITKKVSDANNDTYASPGETLTYTIEIENNGTVNAQNVEIIDTLSELSSYIDTIQLTDLVTISDGVVTTTIPLDTFISTGYIAPLIATGTSLTLTFDVTVINTLNTAIVTELSNSATFEWTASTITGIPYTATATSMIQTTEPKLTLEKKVSDQSGDGIASPYETLTYTIEIKNTGLITAKDVLITDSLGNMLPGNIDNPNTNTVTINNGGTITTSTVAVLMSSGIVIDIAAGATVTITYDVTVSSTLDVSLVASLFNDVDIEWYTDTVPGIPYDATKYVEIDTGRISIAVEKRVTDENSDSHASPGEMLTYLIEINNSGTVAANGLLIQDTLEHIYDPSATPKIEHIEDPSGNPLYIRYSTDGGTTWSLYTTSFYNVGDLMTGFLLNVGPKTIFRIMFVVYVRYDIDESTVLFLYNNATASSLNPMVPDANNDESINTAFADLVVDKVVIDENNDTFASPGEELTYTITIENISSSVDAEFVFIQDNLNTLRPYVNMQNSTPVRISRINTASSTLVEEEESNILQLRTGFTRRIAANEKLVITFTVTVNDDLDTIATPTLSNSVLVNEQDTGVDIDTYDPGFSKDSLYPAYVPGKTVEYEISFVLPSDVASITSLVIIDHYDDTKVVSGSVATITIGATTLGAGDYTTSDSGSGTLTITLTSSGLGKLAINQLVTVNVKFNVLVGADGVIRNNAELEINTVTIDEAEEIVKELEPVTGFTKDTDDYFRREGDRLTFEVSFTLPADFTGYDGILVYDKLPTTLDYIATGSSAKIIGTGTNSDQALTIVHSSGELTIYISDTLFEDYESETVEIIIVTEVNSNWTSGNIVNTAEIYYQLGSTIPNPNTDTPDDTDTETVTPLDPVTGFTKDTDDYFRREGDRLTFEVSFTLPADFTGYDGILVYDELPTTLDYIATGSSAKIIGTGTNSDQALTIVHSSGELTIYISDTLFEDYESETVEIIIVTEVNSNWTSGNIVNTAEIYYQLGSTIPNPNTDTPDDTDTETVTPLDLVTGFTKDSTDKFNAVGDPIVYTISFTLPSDLDGYEGMLVFDELPVELDFVSATGRIIDGISAGSDRTLTVNRSGQDVSVYIPKEFLTNNANKMVEIIISTTVSSSWTSGSIINTAEIYYQTIPATEPDPTTDTPDDTSTKIINPSDFIKTANQYTYKPDDVLEYTITWTLPVDATSTITSLIIVDDYDEARVQFETGSDVLVIGTSTSLTRGAGFDYTIADDLDKITIDLTTAGLLKLVGNAPVTLTMEFKVLPGITGNIRNDAELQYNHTPVGEDSENVQYDNFTKTANQLTYEPEDSLEYTMSWTLPEDARGKITTLEIVDNYDQSNVEFTRVLSFFIGLTPFVYNSTTPSAGDFIVSDDDTTGTLIITLTDHGLTKLSNGATIVLRTEFEVKDTASGDISNSAELYYNSKKSGGDGDDVTDTGFKKDSDLISYVPDKPISYTMTFKLPSDASKIASLHIEDEYNHLMVENGAVTSFIIGATTLSTSDYSVTELTTGVLTITLSSSGLGIAQSADNATVTLQVEFDVLDDASGTLRNDATLYFNGNPAGEDFEEVTDSGFTKSSEQMTYKPGDPLHYEISWVLPDNAEATITSLYIIDSYDDSRVAFVSGSMVFKIGSYDLTSGVHYTIDTSITGQLLITLDDMAQLKDNATVTISYTFTAKPGISGDIHNSAELFYNGTSAGGDGENISYDDFTKLSDRLTYSQGGMLDYTLRWTLPVDAKDDIATLQIIDNYDQSKVSFNQVVSFNVGATPLVFALGDYTISDDDSTGTLTITLTASGLAKLANSAVVILKLEFATASNATGTITNNARLIYNGRDEGGDGETITPSGFNKSSDQYTYIPGDILDYTISWTLPANAVATITSLYIIDEYDDTHVAFDATSVVFTIGPKTLLPAQYTVFDDTANNELIITLIDLFELADNAPVTVSYKFITLPGATGNIKNDATLYYNGTPVGDDSENVQYDNFTKAASQLTYEPGDILDYTMTWTLPVDARRKINTLEIVDDYDQGKVDFVTGSVVLTIGATTLDYNNTTPADGDYLILNDGDKLTIALTSHGLAKLTNGATVTLQMRFKAKDNATGNIVNSAELLYNGKKSGGGGDSVTDSGFTKSSDLISYVADMPISYTMTFRLPSDASKINSLYIIDKYDHTMVENGVVTSFMIGATPLTLGTDYTVTDSTTGPLTITLTPAGIGIAKSANNATVTVGVVFDVLDDAKGVLRNEAELFFNGTPAGEGSEEVKDSGFTKSSDQMTYKPGDTLDYEISWMLPDNAVATISSLRIEDDYDQGRVFFVTGSESITIGSTSLDYNNITPSDGDYLISDDGDIVTITLTTHGRAKIENNANVTITMQFTTLPGISGDIHNDAELFYNGTPVGGDGEDISYDDFTKQSDRLTYSQGGKLDYTLRWTLPIDAEDDIANLEIIDNYDQTKVNFSQVVSFNVGATPLVFNSVTPSAGDYTINDDGTGTLTIALTANGLAKLTNNAVVTLKLEFTAASNATGTITNNARLRYNGRDEGGDGENVSPSGFTKSSDQYTYKPGDTLDYELTWQLPPNAIATITSLIIIDDYDQSNVTFVIGSESLTIGSGLPLVLSTHYTLGDDGDKITITLTPVGIAQLINNAPVRLTMQFVTSASASGDIKNDAELRYNGSPMGDDSVIVTYDDFSKISKRITYSQGGKLDYSLRWTLPTDARSKITTLEIIDNYDQSKVSFNQVTAFTIGGTSLYFDELTPASNDYTIVNNSATGTLTIALTPSGIAKLANGASVILDIQFTAHNNATGTITNNATLRYNGKTSGGDGEDVFYSDFTKDSHKDFYVPGGAMGYTVSWTLPGDVTAITQLIVRDTYPSPELSNPVIDSIRITDSTGVATLSSLTFGTHYTVIPVSSPSGYEAFEIELTPAGRALLINNQVFEIKMTFDVNANAEGIITNNAQLFYNGSTIPDAEDDNDMDEDDFSKTADSHLYAPGATMGYTISWTLPSDVATFTSLLVVDTYPSPELSSPSVVYIEFTGAATQSSLLHAFDYQLADVPSLTVPGHRDYEIELTPAGLAKLEPDGKMEIRVLFDITATPTSLASPTSLITNTASLYYNGILYGEDDETIREQPRNITPPTDLSKVASRGSYNPGSSGQTVIYTISFTLPDELNNFQSFRIEDTIPAGLEYVSIESLMVNGVLEGNYTVTSDTARISVTVNVADLAPGVGGTTMRLAVIFNISSNARGTIRNNAHLYYTPVGGTETHVGNAETSMSQASYADVPSPTSVNLRARKVVSGNGAVISAGQFSFTVFENGVQVATATNDAAGNIVFPAIEYTRTGTYNYTVRETMVSGAGWLTDTTVYNVSVVVTNQGNKLTAVVNYPDSQYPTFHNQYKAGTATLRISKVLVETSGAIVVTGEVFWAVLYVREDTGWARLGRYAIPANTGSTTIPDLEGGKTYQLVEEMGNWYNVLGHVVSVQSSVAGTSNRSNVAFSVPHLSSDMTIDIVIHNEKTGEPDGESWEGEFEEDPDIIELEDMMIPITMFFPDHYAYIIGYPDNTVQPERNITRAEVATVFFRLLEDDMREAYWAQDNPFFDVSSSNWHNNAVSTMGKLGIVNGYPDGSFRPNDTITRGELAAITARFARVMWMQPVMQRGFSDIAGHWAANDIAYAASISWLSGYPDGTFRPNQPITRAEFMTIVNRMLERVPEFVEDLLVEEMIHWTDNADQSSWYYLAVQEATNSHEPDFKNEEFVPGLQFEYEYWLEMIPNRDWALFEKQWSNSRSG
ncbi:MAG: isopeptide-forming domain-containing fimbrial protein [Oscillospiraceae bacterium]|nr:isopeptide-forming domain-containing fimbrial protein [Oscillospiraceae bacterium]